MSVEMIKEVYFRNSATQVFERDRQLGLKKSSILTTKAQL
jgi:hypothetical protein